VVVLAAEDLLALALSRPQEALSRARAVAGTDPRTLSFARQAAGIVLRDRGQMAAALADLRAARRYAQASGDPGRVADVRATLGAALVFNGQTATGLGQLGQAVEATSGDLRGRVLLRRAYVSCGIGRYDDALSDLRRALAAFRTCGNILWEARALNNRSRVHVLRGALARADRDLDRAQVLFRETGQELEAVHTVHNRGVVAFYRCDLPRALTLYERAAQRYADLSAPAPELAYDRCDAYLAAGLTAEAVDVVDRALAERSIRPVLRAELLLAGANAALADGDPVAALTRARQARLLFRRQARPWWQNRAELIIVRARSARGESSRSLLAAAAAVAGRLVDVRAEDAPVALLLAGQLATRWEPGSAAGLLSAAARYRRNPSAIVRATGWLAQAAGSEAAGSSRGLYAACGRGLDALDVHRLTLGSSELRALSTGHGRELARLALRSALASGDPRRVLAWSERWRATALTQPPVRPPRGAASAPLTSRHRDLADPTTRGAGGGDQADGERAVRSRRHQLVGSVGGPTRFDVGRFVDSLGEEVFVELIETDGALHAVWISGGRVRCRLVGPVAAALAAVQSARFTLRQAGRGRPTTLAGLGARLQATLLGPSAATLSAGPVVISPPSRLHDVPWSLLPALADRPVSVVPSAAMWQRARAAVPPSGDRLALVAGPGLLTGGAEVCALARRDPAALLLRDGSATVDACLAALDGARLAHVAAHGRFRPDSPLFSSLMLDDGPLTVHDLESLKVAPHRLILSACDSGVMVPVGADELLGLSAALLSMGTAGVLSTVAEINDEATVGLMLDVHDGLGHGLGLAEALLGAQRRAGDDLASQAAAASFVALGV
jgi:tetratricopeptide (TPR) repeat protein